MDLFLLFFTIFIALVLLSMAWSSISLAPFVPTRTRDLKRIFELADLKEGEVFYELGCGNGRVILYAIKNFPIRVVGIESFWLLWLISRIRLLSVSKEKAKVKFGNLFKEDLSQADVVYFFGMPDSIKKRLKDKLDRELKPGARVVSYAFSLPGWKAKRASKPSQKDVTIYLYER